jgi:hypothetical protein
MRILSPFKDFYDFVVVEPDNKKMYIRETKDVVYSEEEHKKSPERTILSPLSYDKIDNMRNYGFHPFEKGYVGILVFCDRLRSFLVYDNLIYWHYEDVPEEIIKKLQKIAKSRWYSFDDESYDKYNWNRDPLKDILRYKKIDWIIDRHTKEPLKTKLNKIFDTPVLKYCGVRNITLNPKLNELGFNKAITPTEAYQDIYNWIPYNEPEVPKSPDDMSRYEAKGFDKKTSFRPNMK